MKSLFLPILAALTALAADAAPRFNDFFADSTLRVDYVMTGNAVRSDVALNRMLKSPGWAGRRVNLDAIPYRGLGQITMTDCASGDTIYRTGFSTLFQEWQQTYEAANTSRAFENTYELPLPKAPTLITVELFDNRHESVAVNSHVYRPDEILVFDNVPADTAPSYYIHRGGDPAEAIDVAILAEGYTEAERDSFNVHAARAVEAILSHEPFRSRAGDFNFLAVWTPSTDSGVTVPRLKQWRSTAFGSHYDTFYSDRYLTTPHVFSIHDRLAGIPFEHIIILANSTVYGGGGIYNAYTLTTARHDHFAPVVVHEFGHSFGGLADEYFYPGESDAMESLYPRDVEPWEPNITTLVDFDSKWRPLLDADTPVPTPAGADYPVGVYEGAGYNTKGVYRPADRCRMRDNDYPAFCPACRRALANLIDFYTNEH